MNELKIGWAARDVSTEEPVNIPGQFHMRISRGIMDPITVSALVIDNGADLVAFVSVDCVVIRSGLLDEVRAAWLGGTFRNAGTLGAVGLALAVLESDR